MLKIVQSRKIWFTLSAVLCLASIVSLAMWGLKPAVDFTGGSLMELQFKKVSTPYASEIKEALAPIGLGDVVVQTVGTDGLMLKFKPLEEKQHQEILNVLKNKFAGDLTGEALTKAPLDEVIQENRFESVGPTIGKELGEKAKWAIFLTALMIIIYVAWAFNKVSKIVASWKYGVGAVVALLHDVLIVSGLFSILGHFAGVEIDILFVTALLTVLGYSVNDTIVVYDRTRENLHRHPGESFGDTVNRSVNETMARSINTTLTTLITLAAVYIWGGDSIKHFILALLVGITFGAYSSIFIASNLLVSWERWSAARRLKGVRR